MRALACLVLLLAVPAAQAQMYKCVDAQGRQRYSDKPIPDCKNAEVKGQANTFAGQPAAPARAGRVSKEAAERDQRCAQVRQDYARAQRGPDGAERDQRLQQMRSAYAACN